MQTTQSPEDLARVRDFVRSGVARSIRLGARLSYGEVARSLGVSPATVFRWERQQRVPRGDAAIAYLRLLERLMEHS